MSNQPLPPDSLSDLIYKAYSNPLVQIIHVGVTAGFAHSLLYPYKEDPNYGLVGLCMGLAGSAIDVFSNLRDIHLFSRPELKNTKLPENIKNLDPRLQPPYNNPIGPVLDNALVAYLSYNYPAIGIAYLSIIATLHISNREVTKYLKHLVKHIKTSQEAPKEQAPKQEEKPK